MPMLALAVALLTAPPAGTRVALPAGLSLGEAARQFAKSGMPTAAAEFAGVKLSHAVNANYWRATEELARQVGGRVEVRDAGRAVLIARGVPVPSDIVGGFRVEVRGVTCRRDFAATQSVTEVVLALNWESAIPVVRVDAGPSIAQVTDDLGAREPVAAGRSRIPASNCEQLATIRLRGVPRAATRLNLVEGSFTVTAATRYLVLNVPAFGVPVSRAGVTATVSAPVARGSRVEVAVSLQMPSYVQFESFEAGLRLTRTSLVLVSPTGERFVPINFDDDDSGEVARITYRFAGSLPVGAGWAAVVTTPAVLNEYRVPFVVRDIPLP